MRRIALFLLAAVLVISSLAGTVLAEYAGLSLKELQEKHLETLRAMWATDDWESVDVPAGAYQVGVEIPAGEWSLSHKSHFLVVLGTKLDQTRTEIDWDSIITSEFVNMEDYPQGWTATLSNGIFIVIDKMVTFTKPVKGGGFKFK